MRHFRQLTRTDRLNIEVWHNKEHRTNTWIADTLRVHRNTITNELKRGKYEKLNSDWTTSICYSADIADQRARDNLKAKGTGLKIGNDIAFANCVENLMRGVQPDGTIDNSKKYSPAAALAEAKRLGYTTTVCKATLYSYIKKDVFLHLTQKDLIVKGKKKQKKHHSVRNKRPPAGESIEKRPEEINERRTAGHWEIDSVMGKRGTKKCLVTLTERFTRYEMAFIVPDHTAERVVQTLNKIERKVTPAEFRRIFQSITADNGTEFSDCKGMESSSKNKGKRTKMYYAHPYSSWERGSNENQNKMIRRFFPKGYDFTKTTQAEVDRAVEWVNNYPREVLGWRTAAELFKEQLMAA